MKSQNPPPADKISCPKCGTLILVTETLQQQLSERVRLDLEKRIEQEKNRIEREEKQKARERIALELEDLQHQVEERDEKLRIAQEAELSLRRRERELEDRARSVELELVRRVDEEKVKLEQEALRKTEQAFSVELQDLHTQIREKNEIIEAAHQTELELRQRERDLEGKARTLELEVLRRVDEARTQIEEETATQIIQEHRLRDAEKDRQLDDMRRQIEELRRRAEQGSRQIQGEIREHELEELLRTNFPLDDIQPVPKGVRGADILQYISTRAGTRCGSILWESKRARNWNEGWIAKLKDDQRQANADLAVLVTEVLPREIQIFGVRNDIWVWKSKKQTLPEDLASRSASSAPRYLSGADPCCTGPLRSTARGK